MMKDYIVFLIVLLLIDSIYLFSLKKIHSKVISTIQNEPLNVKYKYASIFYLIAPLAYTNFIKTLSKSQSNSKKNILIQLLKYGSLMGLLMYGTFDATNLALFNKYPEWYALMDTAWGMIAISIASILTFKIVG